MESDDQEQKGDRPKPDRARGDRQARLAERLRANLQRRKSQARARRAGDADSRDTGLPAVTDAQPDTDPDLP